MAAPSAQTLQRISAETRLPAATLEKVLRLLDVLQAIAEDRDLKTRVALKGGTALNVFRLRLDRLSVDIDLNYVGAVDRAAMVADRRGNSRPRGRCPQAIPSGLRVLGQGVQWPREAPSPRSPTLPAAPPRRPLPGLERPRQAPGPRKDAEVVYG